MVRCTHFEMKAVVAALAAVFAGLSQANPVNPTVAAGQAAFQQVGKTLTVTNSPGAIINWKSFSIDRGELTRFVQQSASSQVLNRVTGVDPSVILGSLQSNGRVILINPNGVAFGAGAQVDVGGLIVSTLQLKDADFLAGKYKFGDTPGAGNIKNEGTIKTASGGSVILIAPNVENSGLIHTPEGQILLAAGKSVTIADPDKPSIQVEITNSEHQAVNLGTLIGKEVSLYGGLVKNSGTIQATTAVIGQNGKIRLQAKNDVENTGTLQANGPQGGDILIQAQTGEAVVHGLVEAKSTATPIEIKAALQTTPTATETGKGGRIEILAPTIAVEATVDASGSAGGGAILIGGDYQGGANPVPAEWRQNAALQRASLSLDNPYAASPGATEAPATTSAGSTSGDPAQPTNDSSQNTPLVPTPALPRARSTTIGANARIRADALDDGDGGVIVAWSDGTTTAHGDFSAAGGVLGGNGGLTEVSGLQGIDITGHADLSARQGHAGTMLLDPGSITISNATTDAATGTLNNTWVNTQLGTANLVLATTDAGLTTNDATQDITVSAALTWNSTNTLTLNAGRYNVLGANITVTGGGGLTLNAGQSQTGYSTIAGGRIVNLGGGILSFSKPFLVNGTLDNATIINSDGSVLSVLAGRLSGVTLGNATSPNLKVGGTIRIVNGLTLADGAEVNLIGSLYISGYNVQVIGVTPGGSASLTMGSGGTIYGDTSGSFNQILTLGAGLTVKGNGTISALHSSFSVINNAIIEVNGDFSLGVIDGSPVINNGIIKVNGGTLTIGGNWENSGSIDLVSGSINLGGTFTTAGIGTINRNASTMLNVTGVLDNSGKTLDIGGGGVFGIGGLTSLDSGTIKNGTVISGDGTTLAGSSGYLEGVTLGNAASPNLPLSGAFYIDNGLTLANGATINAGSAWLNVRGSGVQKIGPANGESASLVFSGGTLNADDTASGQTLTLGAGLTVSGKGKIEGLSNYWPDTFINNGTIDACDASGTFTVGAGSFGTFVNNGVLRASGGTLAIGSSTANSWSNLGSIDLVAGTVNLGGTFTTAGIGTINRSAGTTLKVTGALDNSGETLDIGSGGVFGTGGLTSLDGEIWNGTVISGDGTMLAGSYGSLNGVTLGGAASPNLSLSGSFYIENGLTLANGAIINAGSTWLDVVGSGVPTIGPATGESASLVFSGGTLNADETGQTLILGEGLTVSGKGTISGVWVTSVTLINNGTIDASDTSGTLTVGDGSFGTFVNNGVLRASGGTLAIGSSSTGTLVNNGSLVASAGTINVSEGFSNNDGLIDIASGTTFKTDNASLTNNATGIIRGAGTLDLGYMSSGTPTVYTLRTLTNNGIIDPGYGAGGVGTLTIKGDLIQGTTGTLHIDLGGTATGQYDRLVVTGITSPVVKTATAQLAGTLEIAEANGFYADVGNAFANFVTASGGVTGSFSSFSEPADVSFTVNLSGAVGITGTTASLTRWADDGNGDWATATNWTRGVPTATMDAVISRSSADPLVTVSTSGATAHSLVVDDALKIDAQTLTIGSGIINGNVTLANGGSITTDGNLYPSGGKTLYWNDGTIDGTGGLNFVNGANIGFSGTGDRVMDSAGLNFSFTDLSLPSGSLTLHNGTLTFNTSGAGETLIPVGTSLNLYGGTLTNNGPLEVSGLFGLYGGTLAGSGAINMAGGTIDMPASSTVNWTATGAMNNSGTLNLANRTITNPITNTGTINAGSGLTFTQLFTNQGTFNLAGNTTTFSGGYSQSSGTTQLAGGTLLGNASFSGGTLTGAGTINGTLALSGAAYALGASELWTVVGSTTLAAGASLGLNGGALTSAGLNVNGAFTLNSGTLNLGGPLNLNAGGSITKAGAGTTTLTTALNQATGATLAVSAGTLELAAGGSLAGGSYAPAAGATLSFAGGTFTLNGATSLGGTVLMSGSSFNGAGALDNTGALSITGNTTLATPFTNSGTVTLSNGVTLTSLGGYTQTAGATQLGTGAGTSATLNGNVAINGGSLGGSGTLGGNLSVGAGTLGVGFSPGLLNISGDLTLSPSSVTNIELGGTTPGTGYDQINVSGLATLDGALNVTTYGGYTPLAGDAFSFLTFGSSIGNFATINLAPVGISLNQYASYLELLMGGAIIPPTVPPSPSAPLEVLLETTAQTAETLATTPTSEGFTRVVNNESDTSLGQIVVQLSIVDLNSAEEREFQQCR